MRTEWQQSLHPDLCQAYTACSQELSICSVNVFDSGEVVPGARGACRAIGVSTSGRVGLRTSATKQGVYRGSASVPVPVLHTRQQYPAADDIVVQQAHV